VSSVRLALTLGLLVVVVVLVATSEYVAEAMAQGERARRTLSSPTR